ncbi:ATP-binding cassette domain-containing protein [Stomatobaculum longum]|uniref:ATP-binding cassette domain-containing protein n=1 Tax=Stomatobaculum longum TaxID=796942 RepID=UPI0028E29BFA|nr:ATP-binding cassette domain-containing protein [Stomatobaculum longum]
MSVENQGVALRVTGAALAYGDTELVRDVNLSAAPGELLALLGPSGSGKTSLLRAIAGFLPLAAGEIRFDGVRVNELPVEERQLGMVFQEHRLFPALTVYRNLEVCLTGTVTARVTAAEAAARIAELLPALGLTGLEARFPAELSGGQQRRVALARALLVRPRLLLLDEPFTGLDALLRRELTELLRREQRSRGLTTVFVTHEEEDAVRIADSTARFYDTAGTRSFRQAPSQRF